MNKYNKENEIIHVEYKEILSDENAKQLKEIQEKFTRSYVINKDKMEIDRWLSWELKNNLPEKSENEINEMTQEILDTLKINEEKQYSLQEAVKWKKQRKLVCI